MVAYDVTALERLSLKESWFLHAPITVCTYAAIGEIVCGIHGNPPTNATDRDPALTTIQL